MDSRSKKLLNQACQLWRAFFVHLDKNYGIVLSEKIKIQIYEDALVNIGNHIVKHRVHQDNMDSFKLLAFFGYYTTKHLFNTTTHGAVQDPIKDCCKGIVHIMNNFLSDESSKRYVIDNSNQRYIIDMLYAEAVNDTSIGIGPNGLLSLFTFILKIEPKSKEEVLAIL